MPEAKPQPISATVYLPNGACLIVPANYYKYTTAEGNIVFEFYQEDGEYRRPLGQVVNPLAVITNWKDDDEPKLRNN